MAGAIESFTSSLSAALPELPNSSTTSKEAIEGTSAQKALPKAPDNEFYAIRPIPGKGHGCFALKNLQRGTRILADSPILLVSEGDYLQADVEEAFAKISVEEKALYWSLSSGHGQDPENWPSKIHDTVEGRERQRIQDQHDARIAKEASLLSIFQNNCMEVGPGAGIFPNAARFNHSCNPNADFCWNANIHRETIHIIHEVKEGDEITVSYCDMTHEKTMRAWELKHYGFVCDCKVCTGDEGDPEGFTSQNIDQRHRISEIEHATSYLRGANIELGVKEPEFVKQLLELAILHLNIGDYSMRLANIYVDLALACEFVKDFANGQDMAANALRIKRVCHGEDSPNYVRYKGIFKRMRTKFKAAQDAKEG